MLYLPVVSVPASVADGCPRSSSGCRHGLRMAPHGDGGDGGSGIRGGSIVEVMCCPYGDGWTVGDGVFLTDIIRARGLIMEDAAHL